jgi:hypothetical protein
MPSTDSEPPRSRRPIVVALAVVVLGVLSLIGLRLGGHFPGSQTAPLGSTVEANKNNLASATNVAAAPGPVSPGTVISSEVVLDKLDAWMAEHPNYHALVESALPSGTVMARMDVFTYMDGTNGRVFRMKAQMFMPQAIQYQAQRKNGKLEVYFPKSDQLIEADTAKMLAAMPALAANQSGMKGLLKLARSSFAEGSADLRVVTLVLNTKALNMDDMGDIYLSLRTDDQGKLLGIDQKAHGQRVITTLKYISFDRDLVSRDAPNLPAGKVAVTNKSFQAAMQEEFLHITKAQGTKI